MFCVYVSGPITNEYRIKERENVNVAMRAAYELVAAGLATYVPHTTWYMDMLALEEGKKPLSYDYLEQDLEWIKRCDAVLRLPGESKGGDIEVKHAQEVGVPVYYSTEEVMKAANLDIQERVKESMPPYSDVVGDEVVEEEIIDLQGQPIITYSSGAKETDIGVRFDLLPIEGVLAAARVAYEGAKKYGEGNWLQGMPCKTMLNHALKHITQYLSGDRSEEHLAHAAWRMLAAIACKKYFPELDEEDIPYGN